MISAMGIILCVVALGIGALLGRLLFGGAESAAPEAERQKLVDAASADDARAELIREGADDAKRSAATEIKRIEDEARAQAEEKAKRVLGTAIQRYAGEYVTERTVSVVPLPDDNMKGRIIGREGRNI